MITGTNPELEGRRLSQPDWHDVLTVGEYIRGGRLQPVTPEIAKLYGGGVIKALWQARHQSREGIELQTAVITDKMTESPTGVVVVDWRRALWTEETGLLHPLVTESFVKSPHPEADETHQSITDELLAFVKQKGSGAPLRPYSQVRESGDYALGKVINVNPLDGEQFFSVVGRLTFGDSGRPAMLPGVRVTYPEVGQIVVLEPSQQSQNAA